MANGSAGRPSNVFLMLGGDLYSVSEVKAQIGIDLAKKVRAGEINKSAVEMFLLGAGSKYVLPKDTTDLDKIMEG